MKSTARTLLAGLVLLGAALFACAQNPDEAALASGALESIGPRRGLCLHLGCGREATAGLTAELAARSGHMVHGLALDDASLARARRAIDAKGLAGRAVVEKVALPPLPYLRDLADLVVIEDVDALAKTGVTMDEVLRVTAPRGVVCVLKDGRWTETVKSRPEAMDEWTHPMHGADGNLVSTDRLLALPVGYRWLEGLPVNITGFAATRAWVIAGGRVYAVGINEIENMGVARKAGGFDLFLSARNAWNGLPLWKIRCDNPTDGTAIMWQNAAPLAADDARVYAAQGDKAIGVDGATGRIDVTFDTKYRPVRLLLLDGVLVTATWKEQTRPKGQWVWYPRESVGTVEGFDAATGKAKWSVPITAFRIIAADGVVYCRTQASEKTPMEVIALDLKTGKERWRVPHTKLGEQADLVMQCAGAEFVALAKPSEKKIVVLAADDGRVLWEQASRSSWLPLVDGALWIGDKRDPKTGKSVGAMPTYLGGHHCSFRAIAGRFLLSTYGFTDMTPAGGGRPGAIKFMGGRGSCVENWVPANGMFYTAQNNCKCIPSAAYGFMAIGHNGDWPAEEDFARTRPVEKGPAFGALDADVLRADDWPTYRHDAERTGATKTALPEKIAELWKTQAARTPEGPLAPAWEAQLNACVTAPVAAAGRVYLAGTDAGQVIALDAATGKQAWSVTLGGRIDTPPTVYRGLCLVGCHDGWVYALRATDGALAWRTRVAPWERRMTAFGAVESVWPAAGSVLVHQGVAYATAGRSSESDGGVAIVALDPATGAQKWARSIGSGALRLTDILTVRDGLIGWRYIGLDPATGATKKPEDLPTAKDYGGGKGTLEGALMDHTWMRTGNRRVGWAYLSGKTNAHMMAWNETVAVTDQGAFNVADEKPLWSTSVGRGRVWQVTAMALGTNAVVLAGRDRRVPAGQPGGFLWLLSLENGKKLAEVVLDAPPALNGVAVADGRIVLSLGNGTVVCLGKAD